MAKNKNFNINKNSDVLNVSGKNKKKLKSRHMNAEASKDKAYHQHQEQKASDAEALFFSSGYNAEGEWQGYSFGENADRKVTHGASEFTRNNMNNSNSFIINTKKIW